MTRTTSPSYCGPARFALASMPVEEYPAIPEVTGQSGVVPGEDFSTAIAQVAFAASRDDVTPVLTGVQLAVSENSLGLVATDRYRVALRTVDWDGSQQEVQALVPARTLIEVGKTFAHGGNISIAFSGEGDREIIAFTAGNKTVTSLLIKGNFPPVQRLFPEQTGHYAVVSTSDLTEAVRRVALVLDRSAPLRFTFSQNEVTMDAAGGDQARASESVDATLTGGDEVTLGLNPQYLLEALGAVKSEFARITFTSSDNANKLSPILVMAQTSVEERRERQLQVLAAAQPAAALGAGRDRRAPQPRRLPQLRRGGARSASRHQPSRRPQRSGKDEPGRGGRVSRHPRIPSGDVGCAARARRQGGRIRAGPARARIAARSRSNCRSTSRDRTRRASRGTRCVRTSCRATRRRCCSRRKTCRSSGGIRRRGAGSPISCSCSERRGWRASSPTTTARCSSARPC